MIQKDEITADALISRARNLENSGDVEAASTAYARAARLSHRKPADAVLALLGAARCERFCLRNANAYQFMERAITLAQKSSPYTYVTTLVESAMLFNTAGLGSEALQELHRAETKGAHIPVAVMPTFLATRASALSLKQGPPLYLHYVDVAVDMAERMQDDRSLCQVLNIACALELQSNLIQQAYAYSKKAHNTALGGKASIDGISASWQHALVLLRMGHLQEAWNVLNPLLCSSLSIVPMLDARLTALTLEIALHVGNTKTIRQLLRRPIVTKLDKIEEPQLLGPLLNVLHGAYRIMGEPQMAFRLLEDGIRMLRNADGSLAFCITAAEHGSVEVSRRARKFLEMRAPSAVDHAYRSLFDAVVERRTQGGAFVDSDSPMSHAAVDAFGTLGWPLDVAKALEIRGAYKEAIRIYRKHGATGDVTRLSQLRVGRGRPRKSNVEISQRQQQIIQGVLAGHTNGKIAAELSLSVSMVNKHLSEIYRRFGIENRYHLIRNIDAGTIVI